jgi:beta-glucosidase-like glycosyl hydrolase
VQAVELMQTSQRAGYLSNHDELDTDVRRALHILAQVARVVKGQHEMKTVLDAAKTDERDEARHMVQETAVERQQQQMRGKTLPHKSSLAQTKRLIGHLLHRHRDALASEDPNSLPDDASGPLVDLGAFGERSLNVNILLPV